VTQLRIASLLPSATEIVYALGLGDQLVAVTHECDFPPDAATKTAVTRNLLSRRLPSSQIDTAVRSGVRDAHTIYALDAARLVELAPDVVLTQSLCEVCAVPKSAVDEAVCDMPRGAAVVSLDPHTLEEMLVRALRTRIDAVEHAIADVAARPRVLCCEWLDPIYCGGHWVPEQVRLAGGEDGFGGRPGEPARVVPWDAVPRYEPEVIVLMPCGYDAVQTAERVAELSGRPGWAGLPAVQEGRVFAANGSAYFSRPGPRLVDGLELLARILHPERGTAQAPGDAALRIAFETDGRVAFLEPHR
jgi:iron complex transport system substrate-binding protein